VKRGIHEKKATIEEHGHLEQNIILPEGGNLKYQKGPTLFKWLIENGRREDRRGEGSLQNKRDRILCQKTRCHLRAMGKPPSLQLQGKKRRQNRLGQGGGVASIAGGKQTRSCAKAEGTIFSPGKKF